MPASEQAGIVFPTAAAPAGLRRERNLENRGTARRDALDSAEGRLYLAATLALGASEC
jgi:hypothetical protein